MESGESEAEYRLRLEVEAAIARTRELEAKAAELKTGVTSLKTQLFRYENIREHSAQCEVLTGLTQEV